MHTGEKAASSTILKEISAGRASMWATCDTENLENNSGMGVATTDRDNDRFLEPVAVVVKVVVKDIVAECWSSLDSREIKKGERRNLVGCLYGYIRAGVLSIPRWPYVRMVKYVRMAKYVKGQGAKE